MKNIARPLQVWRWTAVEGEAPGPKLITDKPSIAVLAFTNMSGDPEQDYFSDGIAEDIITALSKFRSFHVIARNSSFTYKGQPVDIKQVGRELGVRYVLEGSVRKAGSRVRITAQLNEAESGKHVWAERYDRELVDIFDLQDEITGTIAAAISPAFEQAELRRIARKRPENLDAWDLALQASQFAARATAPDFVRARELAEQAVALDPLNTQALGVLAWCHGWEVQMSYVSDRQTAMAAGMRAARRALEIDPSDAVALRSLGGQLALAGQWPEAIETLRQCTVESPNYAHGWLMYGVFLGSIGRYDEASDAIERGTALSPKDPFLGVFQTYQSFHAFMVERYDDALTLAQRAIRTLPDVDAGHNGVAAVLSELGRMTEARAAVAETLRLAPDSTVAKIRRRLDSLDAAPFGRTVVELRNAAAKRYCDALIRAGLPEA